jgi:hypothetical protein
MLELNQALPSFSSLFFLFLMRSWKVESKRKPARKQSASKSLSALYRTSLLVLILAMALYYTVPVLKRKALGHLRGLVWVQRLEGSPLFQRACAASSRVLAALRRILLVVCSAVCRYISLVASTGPFKALRGKMGAATRRMSNSIHGMVPENVKGVARFLCRKAHATADIAKKKAAKAAA